MDPAVPSAKVGLPGRDQAVPVRTGLTVVIEIAGHVVAVVRTGSYSSMVDSVVLVLDSAGLVGGSAGPPMGPAKDSVPFEPDRSVAAVVDRSSAAFSAL